MRILVTGGAGFIGAHLTEKLIRQKHKLLVVDSLVTTGGIPYINPKSKFINGDITEDKIIKKIEMLAFTNKIKYINAYIPEKNNRSSFDSSLIFIYK